MDAILTTLVGDPKPLSILGAILLAWPWIRKIFREISDAEAIRVAGDALRKEMGELLDKEQARVATLTGALDVHRPLGAVRRQASADDQGHRKGHRPLRQGPRRPSPAAASASPAPRVLTRCRECVAKAP